MATAPSSHVEDAVGLRDHYFVWGSTFLAIRVGVREVPPFLFAAMRFSVAGSFFACGPSRGGERLPRGREWASAFTLATLIFVLDYGLLFWSEQRVPSGIAAVMLALIQFLWRFQKSFCCERKNSPSAWRGAADWNRRRGGADEPLVESGRRSHRSAGAVALIIASFTWSIASALTRKLPCRHPKQ